MFDLGWFGSISFDSFLPALLGSTRYDFGWLGWISFDYTFLSALFAIILIDLVLAGDNAVVIALAVRNLQGKQRTWGLFLGAGAAVLVRVICTIFVSQVLRIPLLKFLGGALIAWIAVKMLIQEEEEEQVDQASTLIQAIKLIIIADMVMSTDNMLAVAGASKGNAFLLLFGLGFSIPLVVGTASFLSRLMAEVPDHRRPRRRRSGEGRGRDDDDGRPGPEVVHPPALCHLSRRGRFRHRGRGGGETDHEAEEGAEGSR